jgi:hypothetical protein
VLIIWLWLVEAVGVYHLVEAVELGDIDLQRLFRLLFQLHTL